MAVLLLPVNDGEAVSVAAALRALGADTRWFDLAWFPENASMTARLADHGWAGRIGTPAGPIDLGEISAVYYRQTQPPRLPLSLSEPERRFATVEARFGFGGVFMSLPVRWLSHPGRVADAEYKPLQLATAMRCGLTAPGSIVTNQPSDARDFVAGRPTIYKALMHKLVNEAGKATFIYTTPVDTGMVDGRVSTTLHTFHENVTKECDVRLVATEAGHMFAIAIRTDDPAARQDFRTGYDRLRYEVVPIPRDVGESVARYLCVLGLGLGVFDFAVTVDGVWNFLECGPCSQWAWLEAETAAPIADAIARTLLMTET